MRNPYIKSLSEIRERKPDDQVKDLGTVLEYLLVMLEPSFVGKDPRKSPQLGERVQHCQTYLRDLQQLKDVNFAVGIRNDLIHAGEPGHEVPPPPRDIERAAKHLFVATEHILAHPRISDEDKEYFLRVNVESPSAQRGPPPGWSRQKEEEPGDTDSVPCHRCSGQGTLPVNQGSFVMYQTCPACGGTGIAPSPYPEQPEPPPYVSVKTGGPAGGFSQPGFSAEGPERPASIVPVAAKQDPQLNIVAAFAVLGFLLLVGGIFTLIIVRSPGQANHAKDNPVAVNRNDQEGQEIPNALEKRKPPQVRIEADGQGGVRIRFSVPGAPSTIKTGIRLKFGEAILIATSQKVPSLQIGRIADGEVRWSSTPSTHFCNPNGYFTRLESAPEAEMVLNAQLVPNGTYEVRLWKPTKHKVHFVATEHELTSVVYVCSAYSYRGAPWNEIRAEVLKSIADLPDQVRFQVLFGSPPRSLADGKLLLASRDAKNLATDALQLSNSLGSFEHLLDNARSLQPDVIFLLTNDRRDEWRPGDRVSAGRNIPIHVLFWEFPGHWSTNFWDLSRGRPYALSLVKTLVTETNGTFQKAQSKPSSYFWGDGPTVTVGTRLRTTGIKGPQYSGLLMYADADEVWVQTRYPWPTNQFERSQLEMLRVEAPAPRGGARRGPFKFLPPGSIVD